MIYVGDGNIRADYKADSKSHTLDEDQVASLINALEPKLGKYSIQTSKSDFASFSKALLPINYNFLANLIS